ncbi:MAG: hypothetical protein JWN08_156 [Frankiales bacterium]|nr:hypothetical protein [Frankiales bacterium]
MQPDDRVPLPSPEDDHDVLTFREAGDRLQDEIGREEQRALALAQAGDDDAADVSRRRLDQLRTAALRQDTARRAAHDRSAFFGSTQ